MDNQKLNSIFYTISDEIEGENGNWQFIIDSTMFFCITDEIHNRMRIISPVEQVENLSEEEIFKCMEANFHSALDVKYSFSNGILWSTFIHPLAELSKKQVLDATTQVYSCVKTFRYSYSSGVLSFPAGKKDEVIQKF